MGDIRDRENLAKVLKKYKPQIIFHMAAQSLVRRSYTNPLETYETNIMGTVNILEAARYTPSVRAVVNVTSDKCYENRDFKRGFKETDPMGGYDPYSSSKGCAELITSAYRRSFFNYALHSHSASIASVRAGNVIGGGDWSEDRLVPDCIKALIAKKPIIIRNPDALRPWQHVLEPLYGYLLLARLLYKNGCRFSRAWNFGPDHANAKPVQWVVEKIVALWGGKASWKLDNKKHPHEASYLKLDCSQVRTKVGWRPQWGLNLSLKNTVDWYKTFYNKKEDIFDLTTKQIKTYEKSILK